SSHTDKNRLAAFDCFICRSKGQSATLFRTGNDSFEMRLKQRHDPGLQLGKSVLIALTTKDIMTNLCQTGCSCESYITSPNHRDFHLALPSSAGVRLTRVCTHTLPYAVRSATAKLTDPADPRVVDDL